MKSRNLPADAPVEQIAISKARSMIGKLVNRVHVDKERVDFWIKKGAQPSDSVRTLIARHLTPAPAAPVAAAEAK